MFAMKNRHPEGTPEGSAQLLNSEDTSLSLIMTIQRT